MKRLFSLLSIALIVLSVAALMASCNTSPRTDDAVARLQAYKDSLRLASDTAGLAQYRQWKAMNELSDPNLYPQNGMYANPNMMYSAAAAAPTRTVVRYVPVRSSSSRSYSSSSRSSGYSGGSMSSGSSNTAYRKKGWSKAAKGAVVGGVVGAGAGAIINKKNRGVGAVIGGVLGAGAGYGIGRGMDRRDGRY